MKIAEKEAETQTAPQQREGGINQFDWYAETPSRNSASVPPWRARAKWSTAFVAFNRDVLASLLAYERRILLFLIRNLGGTVEFESFIPVWDGAFLLSLPALPVGTQKKGVG